MEELLVIAVGFQRQVAVVAGAEQALAVVAPAEAQGVAAVVRRRVAEHVEEQAVDVVPVQRLGENLDRLLAIPAAVDAGLIQPVVNCRLAAGFLEEPLGVGVVGVLVGFAQVEPADDADAACVCFLEYLPERVVPFWDIRAHAVVPDLAGVERRDPAQLHQQHVGVEGGHLFDERPGVQRRISLAEVGLEPADGLAHPPVRRRRARRPGAEHRCQEHNPHRHPLRSCSECNGTIMNRALRRYASHFDPQRIWLSYLWAQVERPLPPGTILEQQPLVEFRHGVGMVGDIDYDRRR